MARSGHETKFRSGIRTIKYRSDDRRPERLVMDSEGESSDREEESDLSDSWQSGISPDLDLGRDDDE